MGKPEHNYPLYSGDFFIERQTELGAAIAGILGPIYLDVYENANENTRIDVEVKARGDRGKIVESTPIGGKRTNKITLRNVPRKIMADALGASIGDVTDGVLSVTAEGHTAPAALDEWARITVSGTHEKRIDESAFAIKGTGGTPTYAKGTDYEVNPRTGLWRPLTGGAISAGASVELDISRSSATHDRLTIGAGTHIRWNLMGDLKDDASGLDAQSESVFVGVSSEPIDLMGDEHITATFEGVIIGDGIMDLVRAS